MKLKSFKNWTRQDISDQFGLSVRKDCKALNTWLDTNEITLTKEDENTLNKLQQKLIAYVDIWNEQELIIKFISFIIELVDYDTATYKSFANRKLKGVIDGKIVSGEVDLMVAGGAFEPKVPYFCLHEYKKEKGVDNDPLGQLLIAMMTAQAINKEELPVYGAYIFGRNWFFLTLIDKQYCISNEYVATRSDIFDILKIMKKLKIIIQERENSTQGESAKDV